jgi:hypothetical protein
MSITPDDIADELLDVDENEIEKRLCESECFLYGLAKALVKVRCFKGDPRLLTGALTACMNEAARIQALLAETEAQHKDDARRFQASSADEDWDDYKMRMTA